MNIESLPKGDSDPCRDFEIYRVDPIRSDPTVIWSHLTVCSSCMEEFLHTEGLARDYLVDFEYSSEFSIFRDVYEDWKEKNARSSKVRDFDRMMEDQVPRLPGFEVQRRLGRGGSSEVWLAQQDGLHRSVALKIMHKTSYEQRERLQKECRILASLSHPYLLPIYANGLLDDKVWMALEYCPGGSLNFRLTEPWGARESADLVRKVALAAQAVHEKGIIHRDIKPGNILLGADGEPKLADFDLARNLEAGQESTRQTQILGTPAYIAPEQVRSKKVDARADVHALGGVLYHLLTGRPPFKADSAYEALLMAVHTDPVPPIHLRPGLPKDIDQICRKCLAKNPEDRYPSAQDLAADLDRFCDNKPVKARPLSHSQTAWRWAKRNRGLAITGLAAALALISVAAVSTSAAFQAIHFAGETKELNAKLIDSNKVALENEKNALWELYINRINQAQSYWENGDVKAARDQLDQCPFGLRGWEHHYLHSLFHSNHVELKGRSDDIITVALSPDGKTIAGGGRGNRIQLWDFASAKLKTSYYGHSNDVTSIIFSPNNKLVASSSIDGVVHIWSYISGDRKSLYQKKTGHILSLAYSKDGDALIGATSDGEIIIWDTRADKAIKIIRLSDAPIQTVSVSPSGNEFACGGMDRTIWIFDIKSHRMVRKFQGNHYIYSLCYSPDGKTIATANVDEKESVTIWDAATGLITMNLRGHSDDVRGLVYSPDGENLVSVGNDKKVIIWDIFKGEIINVLKSHSNPIYAICAHKNCSNFITGGYGGEIKLWNRNNFYNRIFKNKENSNRNRCLIENKKGVELIVGTDLGEFRVFNKESLDLIKIIRFRDCRMNSLDISPDGKLLAAAYVEGDIDIVDLATGARIQTFCGPKRAVSKVRFSSNGESIATGGADSTIGIWSPTIGHELRRFSGHPEKAQITDLFWESGGKNVVSADDFGNLIFWDAVSLTVVKKIGFEKSISAIATSNGSGKILVFFKNSNGVIIDKNDNYKLNALEKQGGIVLSAQFSRDDLTFLTADDQRNIRLWDLSRRKIILSINDHTDAANDAAFSDDGKSIYSCGNDRTLRVHSIPIKGARLKLSSYLPFSTANKIGGINNSASEKFGFIKDSKDFLIYDGTRYYISDYSSGIEKSSKYSASEKATLELTKADRDNSHFFEVTDEGVFIISNKKLEIENDQLAKISKLNTFLDLMFYLSRDAKTRSRVNTINYAIMYYFFGSQY